MQARFELILGEEVQKENTRREVFSDRSVKLTEIERLNAETEESHRRREYDLYRSLIVQSVEKL